ncbi:hypothetical protein ACQVGL_05645, partial [Escherichia coli]
RYLHSRREPAIETALYSLYIPVMQQKLELLNAATIRARLRFGNEGKLRERKNLWAWSGP